MQIYQNSELELNPINTESQHDSRSDKYNFFSSQKIINQIVGNNFTHKTTSHARVKDKSKSGYQKHIMIFEHEKFKVDSQNHLQLLVTNAHDGSSSLKFNLGVFRTVCANGLVVGDSFNETRINHINANRFIIEETLEDIAAKAGNFVDMIKNMRGTELNTMQINDLAGAAENLRLGKLDNVTNIERSSTLAHKRYEDRFTDLWTLFNVVQEKAIRGGIKYTLGTKKVENNGNVIWTPKNRTTGPIKGFKKVEEINKQLWNVAEKMAA